MIEHQDPCTSTTCKCYENGQQQEQAAVVAYIKRANIEIDSIGLIDNATLRNELASLLINGAHHQ